MNRICNYTDNRTNSLRTFVENSLIEEFPKFLTSRKFKRKEFIRQNTMLKKTILRYPYKIKMNFKAINKVTQLQCKLCVPRGIFCYPCTENFRTDECYEVKYMVNIENFQKFQEIIENVKCYFDEWFYEYPHTKDDSEKLDNKYFFIWIFIQIIKHIYQGHKISHDKINDIILFLSQVLSKKYGVIYKVMSQYFNKLNHLLKLQENKNKISKLSYFRKAYCPICFEYRCKIHFFKENEIHEIHEAKIIKSIDRKSSGSRRFSNRPLIEKSETDFEQEFQCHGKDCKINLKPVVNLYGIEDNYIDVFSTISKVDFYILNCLLSSDISSNSCFISEYVFKSLGRAYPCHKINKILSICLNENNMKIVDNYLEYEEMFGQFPRITDEKIFFNYINNENLMANPTKKLKRELTTRRDYIPCNHPGLCNEDLCPCTKRGMCEKFCVCLGFCPYQFKGCDCDGCCDNSSEKSPCKCAAEFRECDPDLCIKCGACKYYQSKEEYALKYLERQSIGLCRNMSIFFSCPKQTAVGKSVICDGYGLFAMENIRDNEFICEYKGEILDIEETDRRSVFNEPLGLNYAFQLTEKTDIEAFRIGNSMRFVNHSSSGYQNCYARGKYVRGIFKIGLFALRSIKKGEELYFDYLMKVNVPWLNKYNRYINCGKN